MYLFGIGDRSCNAIYNMIRLLHALLALYVKKISCFIPTLQLKVDHLTSCVILLLFCVGRRKEWFWDLNSFLALFCLNILFHSTEKSYQLLGKLLCKN